MVMVRLTPSELKYLVLRGLFENELKAKTTSARNYYDVKERAREEVARELGALLEELRKENTRQI